jgi:hypothetical protein
MDINMKNVELGRLEGTQWITIDEKNEKGVVIRQTKLLVDDGTKSLAQYQAEVRNLANKNSWDKLEDLAMIVDFALTITASKSMSLKEFLTNFKNNTINYYIPAALFI